MYGTSEWIGAAGASVGGMEVAAAAGDSAAGVPHPDNRSMQRAILIESVFFILNLQF